MEPFLVKVLATALTLSQVLTTPNALKTHFDPDSDQQVAQLVGETALTRRAREAFLDRAAGQGCRWRRSAADRVGRAAYAA